ncbi:MAG: ABC transporter ATP-binding protein [Candidatus Manganitrophaceae bacterium]|nr:MAG: ABC transporter ATP-binding protein [Candidatus Manganitrophaceae bacterium]
MDLLEVEKVSKVFNQNGVPMPVLKEISFRVQEGEFIALVGPSGSGKSTLLRILNGLIPPTEGRVLYRGKALHSVNLDSAMVFQSFALFPWLTVLGNVELGLEARGFPIEARRKKAIQFIEKVGLDGFEEAYPRELSGGMKQRVGIARALAVEPKLLCMDEPFSALDPLTSLALREEVLMLWEDKSMPVNTIIMVTHIIEEAVFMADRVLVLSTHPGTLVADIPINVARPRDRKDPVLNEYSDRIFSLMA